MKVKKLPMIGSPAVRVEEDRPEAMTDTEPKLFSANARADKANSTFQNNDEKQPPLFKDLHCKIAKNTKPDKKTNLALKNDGTKNSGTKELHE